jgi:hypothetical protein
VHIKGDLLYVDEFPVVRWSIKPSCLCDPFLTSTTMRFLSIALAAALSRVVTASLQVVPGGTWTTVS